MSGRITLCTIVLVTALLLPTPAAAADSSQDLLGQAWGWLSALWGDHGCGIDPNGGTCVQPKLRGCIDPNGGDTCVQEKHRCGIDPNGNTVCSLNTSVSKGRCGIDPNGSTACSPNTSVLKVGCGINPDGRTVCVP